MASITSKKSRKGLALGLAVLGVAGLSLASAASLTVNSATLGSGVQVVASCDADVAGIDVSYGTSFAATIPGYRVTTVTLKNVDATCAGKTVTVDLLNGTTTTAASLGNVAPVALTLTTGTSQALTVVGTVDAAAVKGVAVVING